MTYKNAISWIMKKVDLNDFLSFEDFINYVMKQPGFSGIEKSDIFIDKVFSTFRDSFKFENNEDIMKFVEQMEQKAREIEDRERFNELIVDLKQAGSNDEITSARERLLKFKPREAKEKGFFGFIKKLFKPREAKEVVTDTSKGITKTIKKIGRGIKGFFTGFFRKR